MLCSLVQVSARELSIKLEPQDVVEMMLQGHEWVLLPTTYGDAGDVWVRTSTVTSITGFEVASDEVVE